jgi:uncharacterized protein (TIGR03790 family)
MTISLLFFRQMAIKSSQILFMALLFLTFLYPSPCNALEPDEILVLANRNAARSVGLAKYYMERRGIPEDHLLQLWVTDQEQCSREDYEKKIVPRVREYLRKVDPGTHIRCLVIIYGLPLRASPPEVTREEQEEIERLKTRLEVLKMRPGEVEGEQGERQAHRRRELEGIEKRISLLNKKEQGASLDSELALVLKEGYSLSKWIPNPFFLGYMGKYMEDMPDKGEVLMVSRLDGPSPEIVRRIIDDSIKVEKTGLKGTAYFDARWPRPKEKHDPKKGIGYGFYDRSIYLAADRVKESGKMEVVINDKPELFQPGECPDAALYCGWYSLARYVDAFDWKTGSVGYHIASAECQTLKRPGSQVWCKRMLEEGVAATLGPVSEPYVQAFPIPEMFFSLLLDGYWTLAECYALSQPFWSWQMVLIGDPLYRPFLN